MPKPEKLHLAFGEQKILKQWAQDPRCRLSYTALRERVKKGETVEAILSGVQIPAEERKRNITAFGETKMASEWALDRRCSVTLTAICQRLDKGMNPEEAISAPISYIVLLEAFGEAKTISDWARDPRCVVSRSCLGRRIGRGERLEDALTFVGRLDRH